MSEIKVINGKEIDLDTLSKKHNEEKVKMITEIRTIARVDFDVAQKIVYEYFGMATPFSGQKLSLKDFLITSGFNFEGYEIIKYHGFICGESVIGGGFLTNIAASFSDLFGEESDMFSEKLERARNAAMSRLLQRASAFQANAIIGLDVDYVDLPGSLVGVIANGTAVTAKEL